LTLQPRHRVAPSVRIESRERTKSRNLVKSLDALPGGVTPQPWHRVATGFPVDGRRVVPRDGARYVRLDGPACLGRPVNQRLEGLDHGTVVAFISAI
jgi:hypothetical protein